MIHVAMIAICATGKRSARLAAVVLGLWTLYGWHHGMQARAQTIIPPAAPPPLQSAAKENLKPASRQQLQDYLQQAGLTVCFLVKRKVDFRTALAANTSTLLLLLSEKHNSLIEGRSTPISLPSFTKNIGFDITIKAVNSCPRLIPDEIRSEARRISDRMKDQLRKGSETGNEKQ